ncbi:FtsB family cell division protein [Lactovum miscens]|uniref:Cell division protein DivIC n=1 Tax=Lactovum miscens TaxID=190387 RepID=A0A841C6V9_9LACT|nr:septum formation initiator family protein [Lactovum miscens]MBB5887332.1 cell division protein DivIC [Lactovum miscens]
MDQQTNNKPRVVRLNNEYTNQQMAKHRQTSSGPKRKFLGLILITVVIVLAIPTYGLVKSFQSLQSARTTETRTISQSKDIKYMASSQAELIKNMQNSVYLQKYARARYQFVKPGEKIFTTPSSSSSVATQNEGN